jgi:CRP/FNR family transcriptional regulator, polysaccharide utilization system transcription regulator
MKVSRKILCSDCPLKCDIYETMTLAGIDYSEANTIHAKFNRHEMISKQGAPVSHAIYLVSGTAKLFIEGLNNRNIILYLMKPPSYIGLLSFFESVHYNYSVTAVEECEVCMIDLQFLKRLYMEQHGLLLKLNKAFGTSVRNIMHKIISLNQKQIRGRVAESLLYLAEFYNSTHYSLPLTRKELGELSGISEENAVRLLSEFKSENIISCSGRDIEILDPKLLRKISDLG